MKKNKPEKFLLVVTHTLLTGAVLVGSWNILESPNCLWL